MIDEISRSLKKYDRVAKDCLRKKYDTMKRSGAEVYWETVQEFMDWCAESGWTYGLKLKRLDFDKGYTPDNLIWVEAKGDPQVLEQMKNQWEAGVGPVREKLRPYLDAIAKKKAAPVTVFRYEHPDLVREGIVWTGGAK